MPIDVHPDGLSNLLPPKRYIIFVHSQTVWLIKFHFKEIFLVFNFFVKSIILG